MEEYFVLDESGEPRQERDLDAWERWFATADRSIARTRVSPEITVLTMFRGIDDVPDSGDQPKLFESRVFGGVLDAEEVTHRTRVESLAAHDALAAWCRIGNSPGGGLNEELDEPTPPLVE